MLIFRKTKPEDKKTIMMIKLLIIACVARTSLSAALHWEIDWLSSGNSYGTYATKELLPRLQKLDGILQNRVAKLEEEIGLNFSILMSITGMMGIVLAMTIHACYASCKQRMDSALPPPVKPTVSRLRLVRPAENTSPIEIKPLEMDMDLKPKWVERPIYKCRSLIWYKI